MSSAVVTTGQQSRLQMIRSLRSRSDRLEKRLFGLWNEGERDSNLLDENILVSVEIKLLVQEYRALYDEDPE